MAYDAADGYTVLFGGYGPETGTSADQAYNDTWILQDGNWSELHPAIAPPLLVGASMAYDAYDKEVVLFGGWECDSGSCWTNLTNQTWTFRAGVWTHVALSVAPSPRMGAALAYDPRYGLGNLTGELILVGGLGSYLTSNGTRFSPLNDTWGFANGTWTNLTATLTGAPPPSYQAGIAFDEYQGALVLFGGESSGGVFENQTWWLYNDSWRNVTLAVAPPPVAGPGMAFDPSTEATILFGGLVRGAGGALYSLNETWELTAAIWTELSPPSVPPDRWAAGMVEEPVTSDVLLFGGEQQAVDAYLDDAWTFDNGTWYPVGTSRSVPLAGPSAMAFDAADNETVLLSPGYPGQPAASSATWVYRNGTWTRLLIGGGPSARTDEAIAYDAKDRYILLYGGLSRSGAWLNDTWRFQGGNWSQLEPRHRPALTPTPELVYDAHDGYVLFGGDTNGSTVWAWNGTDWESLPSHGTPRFANWFGFAMAYDARDGYVVAVQAANQSCPGVVGWCLRTWSYVAGNWTERTNLSSPLPPAVYDLDLTWDPSARELLLFGGIYGNGSFSNQTWSYAAGAWTRLAPAVSPQARYDAAMAFDAADGYPLLFGGLGTDGVDYADSWAYVNGSWGEILPLLNSSLSALDTGIPLTLELSPLPGPIAPSYSFEGLPPGCASANASTLDCVPTGSGNFTVEAVITPPGLPSYESAPVRLEIHPHPAIARFGATPNPVTLGNASELVVQPTGGTPPYKYAYTGLPSGCSSADQPELTCAPGLTGNFSVNVTAADRFGEAANASLRLSIVLPDRTGTGPGTGGHHNGSPPSGGLGRYLSQAALVTLAVALAGVLVAAVAYRGRTQRQLRLEGAALVEQVRKLGPEDDPPSRKV